MIEKIKTFIQYHLKYCGIHEYVAESYDTLGTIARKFNVDGWAIQYLNRKNPDCGSLIFSHKKVWIPQHRKR